MSDKIKNAIRMVAGGELGYTKEGTIQWYYTMSMVISSLVILKNYPSVATKFMLLFVSHFVLSYIYGSIEEEEKEKRWVSFIFVFTNLIIVFSALLFDPGITFLSFTFIVFMVYVASVMDIFAVLKQDSFLPAILNLLVFVAFLICVFMAPIPWYGKVIFIIVELILHPVIDYLQEFIPPITELVNLAWTKVFK